jgi:hypothetical protein
MRIRVCSKVRHVIPSSAHIVPRTTHSVPNCAHFVPTSVHVELVETILQVPSTQIPGYCLMRERPAQWKPQKKTPSDYSLGVQFNSIAIAIVTALFALSFAEPLLHRRNGS